MQFYKIDVVLDDDMDFPEGPRALREAGREKSGITSLFNDSLDGDAACFVSDFDEHTVIGMVVKNPVNIYEIGDMFIKALGIRVHDKSIEEITFNMFCNMLRSGNRYDFIDDDEILDNFGLMPMARGSFGRELEFDENIIQPVTREELDAVAVSMLSEDTLAPELERIYTPAKNKRALGHPVHYIIQTDDSDCRRTLHRAVIGALYENGRIFNRRYTFTDIAYDDRVSVNSLKCLYTLCEGGALIIRYHGAESEDGEFAGADRMMVEKITDAIKANRNRVLTIICLPRECTRLKDTFYEYLNGMTFVEIKEEHAYGEKACQVLKNMAKEAKVRTDRKLLDRVKDKEGYLLADLHRMFDDWYGLKLKTNIYPQYSSIECKNVVKEAHKGDAYKDFMEMIGLDSAKKVLNQALNYHKAQKIFRDRGMKTEHLSMHMVFTGNPGTAKTTVARLFAQVMRDNELLSKSTFVEVGRSDLVGRYVGWTAPTVKKKFKEAEGGVLFIDEAYSLVDDRDGLFGDEAINTIVQEMENHRDDVMVIFAGYPDKMEGFLKKNPGLRSRIAFHVNFDDYSAQELTDIARLTASRRGFKLTEEACSKLEKIFAEARNDSDFGNGRFVRNTLDKARLAQSTRLIGMDMDDICQEDLTTITAEDIEMPEKKTAAAVKRIGFCA